jgi:hypothetical protein
MRLGTVVVALLLAGAARLAAGDAASRLTQGKLEADLGNREAASAAFAEVAKDESASAALRSEALVRLGLERRKARDARGAVQAFDLAWQRHGQDKDARRFLVHAVGGALPGPERWDAIWRKVVLKVDGPKTERPSISVVWPGVPAPRTYSGQPLSLDVKEGRLYDVFRLIADVTGLNVVVHPGVSGTITFAAENGRWDEMLDRILAPNGLAASHVGNVLEVAVPERLGTKRTFAGKPADVDFKEVDLPEALRRIAATGGREVVIDPDVSGQVTIKLNAVPWDQAFDLVARLNGLAYKDDGRSIRVARAGDLR